MTDPGQQREFADFVRTHWSQLMSIAVAVSGSRHEAEDLVQTALTNTYARWHKIRADDAVAYLRRSIANAHISRWRRHHGAELSVSEPPDLAGRSVETSTVEDRLTLVPMLRTLPPRQRAVLVLRYLCDLSDDDVAATLGPSASTVRSQAARGLATLRERRADVALDDDDEPTDELIALR